MNNYRQRAYCYTVLATILLLCAPTLAFAKGAPKKSKGQSKSATLVIFHTNDSHARVSDGEGSRIGFARLKTIVDAERAKPGQDVLLLDAGDTLHGRPFATIAKGSSIISILNALKYDAMAPGNHDFNYGYTRLLELAEQVTFPILAANVLDAKSQKSILPPYQIITKSGVRFGVFGLATPETLYKTHPNNVVGLEFADPIKVARRTVAKLKRKGADVIIGVGHIGLDAETKITSQDIVQAVPNIDLFIDGHSHTMLPQGRQVDNTLIVQAGEHLKHIGKVVMQYSSGGGVTLKAELIGHDAVSSVAPDREVKAIIAQTRGDNETLLNEVIGTTATVLNGERAAVRTGETNLGNLITKAMRRASNADIALMNGGGIRASLNAGAVTKGDVLTVLPFGNSLIVLQLSGAQLQQAIKHGIQSYPKPSGAFPHIAGVRVVFDADNNIVSMTLEDGSAVEPLQSYTLATNDFLAAGGDAYTMFQGARIVSELGNLDEIVIDEIAAHGTAGNETDGRMVQQ